MKYFIYKYSPKTIGLTPQDNLKVIVPRSKVEEYLKLGFNKISIIHLKNLTFYSLISFFRTEQKLELIEEIFTLDESLMSDIGLLSSIFTSGIKGTESKLFFKDKYYMRSILNGIVKQPRIFEEWDITQLPKQGIIKPRRSEAGKGVFIYNTKDALQKDLRFLTKDTDQVLIEELVDYEVMLSCDGIVSNGKLIYAFVHEYIGKITEISEKNINIKRTASYYWKNPKVINAIIQNSQKVVDYLGDKNDTYPIHFEWFYSEKKNELIFCEGACRFGGARIPFLIEDAFGLNILSKYWEVKFNKNIENKKVFFPKNIASSFLAESIKYFV